MRLSPASCFTGSTAVARTINRDARREGRTDRAAIAETGGITAMIVDATALPEQVADMFCTSASAPPVTLLRLAAAIAVQDDVADRIIQIIAGAARELLIGDPADTATHVGPGDIDGEAR